MNNVFIYLDNSNIFREAQRLAEERYGDKNARSRVRLHFENLLRLCNQRLLPCRWQRLPVSFFPG